MKMDIGLYILTLSILSLCALIIYFQSSLTICAGLAHIIRDLFLYLILIFCMVGFVGSQLFKILKYINNRKSRIVAIALLLTGAVFAFQGPATWRTYRLGQPILKASLYADQLDIGRIELLSGNRCYITYGHIDWTCSFPSTYERQGDTLKLNGNLAEVTQHILADTYLVSDTTFVPLLLDSILDQRPEILSIELVNFN